MSQAIEFGTTFADEIGFTPERFGKYTVLHRSGKHLELSKEFRDPKYPEAITELRNTALQHGYDFKY